MPVSRLLIVLALLYTFTLSGLAEPVPELIPQSGHAMPINHTALSSTGLAATASEKEVKIWSAEGRVMGHLALRSEFVGMGFSEPNGNLIVVEAEGRVRSWSFPGLVEARPLSLETAASAAVVQGDSVYLLAAQTIKRFSLLDGTVQETLDAKVPVSKFAVGQDSSVGAMTQKGIVFWPAQRDKVSFLPWVGDFLSISSDGQCLALTKSKKVQIVSSLGKLLAEREFSSSVSIGWVSSSRLAVATFNGPVFLWEYRRDLLDEVAESNHWEKLATVPGSFVCSYSDFKSSRGRALVWHQEGDPVRLEGLGAPLLDIHYHPPAKSLLALTFNFDVVVFSTVLGRTERVMDIGSGMGYSLAPTIKLSKKKSLFASFVKGSVSLWDFESGDRLFTVEPLPADQPRLPPTFPDGTVIPIPSAPAAPTRPQWANDVALEFHPRKDSLMVFTPGYLSEYSFEGELLERRPTPYRAPVDAAVSPSGKRIAVCEKFGLTLTDLESGKSTELLDGHGLARVDFGPDDDTLVVRNVDGSVTLIEHGKSRLVPSDGRVLGVTFSPDGKSLVLGDNRGRVSVVPLQGSETRAFEAHPGNVVNGLTYAGETLVTCSREGDFRLWSTSSNLLASVFPLSGQEWLAVSPQGFFDGSSLGQRALDWKVGETYYRVDQFFKDFFRPGLVALLFSGKEPIAKVSTILSLPSPPEVEILSPTSGAPISGTELEVELKVVDTGGGISDVRLFHNGHRVMLESDQSRSTTISLVSGVNEIRASAFNADQSVESRGDRVRVVCQVAEAGRPVLYQLMVGVDKYPGGQRLQYAAADAKAASAILKSELYSEIDSRVLLDGQATRSEILRHLREIADKAKPQDTLVLYLAGHGTLVGEAFLFLPHDGSFGTKDGGLATGLKWEEIAERLAEIPATRQFIALDTCHSGAAVALSDSAVKWVKASHSLARDSGCYLIAAANSEQTALETDSLGHGLLTYAILEALGGDQPAKAPQDEGVVTAGGLVYYISTAVPKLAKKHGLGHKQEVVQFSTGVDFPIAKPSGP